MQEYENDVFIQYMVYWTLAELRTVERDHF